MPGFINAVLRKVQQTDLDEIIRQSQQPGNLELEYSVPQWLFEYINQVLGPNEIKAFLKKSLQSPSV